MKAKKNQPTPGEQLEKLVSELAAEIAHWMNINEYGCNDPFWPDGCNMNLTRNHVIYYKRKIAEHCGEYKLPLPDLYYRPTPPEVSETYVAAKAMNSKDEHQQQRIKRLREFKENLTTKQAKYDEYSQQTLW